MELWKLSNLISRPEGQITGDRLQVTGYRGQVTGFGTAFSVQRTAVRTVLGAGVGCGVEIEGGIGGGRGVGGVLGWFGGSGGIGGSAGGVLFAFANAFFAGSPARLAAAVPETAGSIFDGRELAENVELPARVASTVRGTDGFVCRLRSRVLFAHQKPCGNGNPRRHPYQGRDRQRIPRRSAKSRNRSSALCGGEPAAIGGGCRVQRPAEVLPQRRRRL